MLNIPTLRPAPDTIVINYHDTFNASTGHHLSITYSACPWHTYDGVIAYGFKSGGSLLHCICHARDTCAAHGSSRAVPKGEERLQLHARHLEIRLPQTRHNIEMTKPARRYHRIRRLHFSKINLNCPYTISLKHTCRQHIFRNIPKVKRSLTRGCWVTMETGRTPNSQDLT